MLVITVPSNVTAWEVRLRRVAPVTSLVTPLSDTGASLILASQREESRLSTTSDRGRLVQGEIPFTVPWQPSRPLPPFPSITRPAHHSHTPLIKRHIHQRH